MGESQSRGGRQRGKVISAEARAFFATVKPLVLDLRSKGLSYQQVADHLNAQGLTTREGGRWMSAQIGRVLKTDG